MSLAGRLWRRLTGTPDPQRLFDWGRGHIDVDKELPFLHEQVRSHWSTVPVRMTGPTLLDNFTNETQEMRLAYRRALAEPAIKSALLGKIFAVMALKLQVKPAGAFPFDKEVAEFVEHALTKCQGGSPDIVWQILSGGLIDGFSVCEKVYREEERGRFKGKKSLLKLKSKDTRYIQYEIDAYRNVVKVFNMRGNAGVGFPPSDFVLFRYLSLFESPWGMSDLRAAYRAAEMLPAILRLRMIFLDKFTGPFIHAKVQDPAFVEEMKEQLKLARAGGFITTTPADDITVIDLATRGTSEFLAAIKDLREEVAIGISGAFLTMMTGDGGAGQRGNSEVQQDTVDLFIRILKHLVETCINEQLVPDLVDPNYGSTTDLPTVILETPNPEEVVNQLKIYESLHILELPLSKKALYELSGAVPPDPNDPADALEPPSATAPGAAVTGLGRSLPGGNPLTKPAGKFDEEDEWDEEQNDGGESNRDVRGGVGEYADVGDEQRDDDGKWTSGGGGGGGGGKPPKGKGARPAPRSKDDLVAAIAAHQAEHAKADFDPDAELAGAHAIVADLAALGRPQLAEVLRAAAVGGVYPGSTKAQLLQRATNFLTVNGRAVDRGRV